MGRGNAIGISSLRLSYCRNEIHERQQGSSRDGLLGAELYTSGFASNHPGWNLQRGSRWIPDKNGAVATTRRGDDFQRLPEVRMKGVVNRDV